MSTYININAITTERPEFNAPESLPTERFSRELKLNTFNINHKRMT